MLKAFADLRNRVLGCVGVCTESGFWGLSFLFKPT